MGENSNSNPWYDMLYRVAAAGIQNQKIHDGDYRDKDGYLICGKCHQPRQTLKTFKDGYLQRSIKPFRIAIDCKCDKERKAAEEKVQIDKENMERVKRLKNISLMDEKFMDAKFEFFEKNNYNERNFKLCKRYAEKFDQMEEKNQGLLMWGNVGTGKSFAAACIANYLLEHYTSVIMTSFVKILEVIQSGEEQEAKLMKKIAESRLVIFDDLGAERNTDYALEKVYNIIDSRYRSGKPMILTTNLSIEEMKAETDIRYSRIYDRIFEICYPMQYTGTSWRKKAAAKRFEKMKSLLEDEE